MAALSCHPAFLEQGNHTVSRLPPWGERFMGLGEKLEAIAEAWCVMIPGPGQEAGGLVPAIHARVDCPVYKTVTVALSCHGIKMYGPGQKAW